MAVPRGFPTFDACPTLRLAATHPMVRPPRQHERDRYPHLRDHSDDGPTLAPPMLVAYPSAQAWLDVRHHFAYRDWSLDSGAFSARSQGIEIDLDAYIAFCAELLATDPTLTEVFALDVIGDWEASLRNTERMWAAGVPAIPAYHMGEPEAALLHIARTYPKIALGGMADIRQPTKKLAWAAQCFKRVWPKPIHGFGATSVLLVRSLPWHSIDSTNWELGPTRFGTWQAFPGTHVRWRGGHQNLRIDMEHHLALEEEARRLHRADMALLAAQHATWLREHGYEGA